MSNIQKFPEGLQGTAPNFLIYLEFVCLERFTESSETWGVFPFLDECYNPMGKKQGRIGESKVILTQCFFWIFLFSETGCFEKYRQKVMDDIILFEATIQKYTCIQMWWTNFLFVWGLNNQNKCVTSNQLFYFQLAYMSLEYYLELSVCC